MIDVTVDVSDLVSKAVRFEAELKRESHAALVFVASAALDRLQTGFYFRNRTGSAAKSFTLTERSSDRVTVGSRSKVAFFLNGGTSPHTITPRAAGGVLRFVVNGRTVFARSVRHPGTKAIGFESKEQAIGERDLGHSLMTAAEHAATTAGL